MVFLHHTTEREIVRDVKGKLAYIAWDFDTVRMVAGECSGNEKAHEFPDGNTITAGCGRFAALRCSSSQATLVRELAASTIPLPIYHECDVDTREDLYSTVVLSGGTTMSASIGVRMTKQLTARAPSL